MIKNDKTFLQVVEYGGGTVTRWQETTPNGVVDILYPWGKALGDKMRGGIPICFPHLGPPMKGEGYDLPQHGFLRDIPRAGGRHNPKYPEYHVLGYTFANPATDLFEWKTEVETVIACEKGILTHLIRVRNRGLGKNPMPIGLGIHPYFNMPNNGTLSIRDRTWTFTSNEPFESEIVRIEKKAILKLPSIGTMVIQPKEAYLAKGVFVIWKDLGPYICVEPVIAPPDAFGSEKGVFLSSTDSLTATCNFSFTQE